MELSLATLDFGQNVLKETNKYEMLLTDKADLAGLPESVLEAAQARAKAKSKEGWLFDLSAPSYTSFMKYSHDAIFAKNYIGHTTPNALPEANSTIRRT